MKKIIYFTLLLSNITVFAQIQEYKSNVDRIEAIVGDKIILKSDIQQKYFNYKANGMTESFNQARCQIIEDLLFEKLLIHRAELDSIEIQDDEIIQEVQSRLNYYINQMGSVEKVEKYFKQDIRTIRSELRDIIRNQLLSQRIQMSIIGDIQVTPAEMKAFFSNLDSAEIPIIETKVVLEQLIIQPKITEEEVKRIRDKLNNFRERANNGEDFKVLAALYSDDIESANKGGDIGFVSRGDLVSEFEKAAFRLKENEISKIIKTEYGYHIIKLIERMGERINVCHILLKPNITSNDLSLSQKEITDIEQMIKDSTISFEEAVKQYSNDKTKNNAGLMINPVNGSNFYTMNELDPSLRYLVMNMKSGDISAPLKFENQDRQAYRLIRLKNKTEEHIANIVDDYDIIQKATINFKKQEKLNEWISKYVSQTYVHIENEFNVCDFDFKWKE
ncbi:MAG: peptidylprolyl isomerase [Bacteroidota bacterium]|nr:peptidylprolyl isomerase [Bacteroidota bacterium]